MAQEPTNDNYGHQSRANRSTSRVSNKSYFYSPDPAKKECVILEVAQVNTKGALTGIVTHTEYFVHYNDTVEQHPDIADAFTHLAQLTLHWPTL